MRLCLAQGNWVKSVEKPVSTQKSRKPTFRPCGESGTGKKLPLCPDVGQ